MTEEIAIQRINSFLEEYVCLMKENYSDLDNIYSLFTRDMLDEFLCDISEYCDIIQANKIDYDFGCTKLCLFFSSEEDKNYPYVFKIPLYQKDGKNYCQLESNIYSFAIDYGVEDAFAETKFLCNSNKFNLPIYRSIKCEIDNRIKYSLMATEKIKLSSPYLIDYFDNDFLDSGFVGAFINSYGEDFILNLIDFLNEYNVNDLSAQNIGIFKDKPKFIDYSGFHEEYSSSSYR